MSGACPVQIARAWIEDYLTREHPSMPRPGAVCPFVRPALAADAIEVRAVPVVGTDPVAEVLEVARQGLADFAASTTTSRADSLRALVLVIPSATGRVIDDAHALVKSEAVDAGLMIGQFHEMCEEASARNEGFPVNRSPVPLLAIRRMTVHDILFLHGDDTWFRAYAERFGHLYECRRRIDPAFRELYAAAIARRHPVVPLGAGS
ncbi:DUF6875 domain-containing protein [Brachybacterium sp. YJGR34]|uniref:DUF6875 domain-containing protein n=1 Tax=Brachybacterium sp. YJGR34 TaxID=2059911 RepID=UPI001300424B|nr:hypothetical protein [Brachybacterium sp. YJGR34]